MGLSICVKPHLHLYSHYVPHVGLVNSGMFYIILGKLNSTFEGNEDKYKQKTNYNKTRKLIFININHSFIRYYC